MKNNSTDYKMFSYHFKIHTFYYSLKSVVLYILLFENILHCTSFSRNINNVITIFNKWGLIELLNKAIFKMMMLMGLQYENNNGHIWWFDLKNEIMIISVFLIRVSVDWMSITLVTYHFRTCFPHQMTLKLSVFKLQYLTLWFTNVTI